MRLFQAALDTPRDSPFSATLSVHDLRFTVYAPSKHAILLVGSIDSCKDDLPTAKSCDISKRPKTSMPSLWCVSTETTQGAPHTDAPTEDKNQ